MARTTKAPPSKKPEPKSRALPIDLVLLGLDPGTNSFAYAVTNVKVAATGRTTFKVLQHGLLHSTLRDIKYPNLLRKQRLDYRQAIQALKTQFGIRAIIAERYMLRRGSGGTAIESINLMLGILLELDLPTKLIPASQWKNFMSKQGVDLDALYLEGKPLKLTPHQIDATHIAAYGAHALGKGFDLSKIVPQLVRKAAVPLGVSTKKDSITHGYRKAKRRTTRKS